MLSRAASCASVDVTVRGASLALGLMGGAALLDDEDDDDDERELKDVMLVAAPMLELLLLLLLLERDEDDDAAAARAGLEDEAPTRTTEPVEAAELPMTTTAPVEAADPLADPLALGTPDDEDPPGAAAARQLTPAGHVPL